MRDLSVPMVTVILQNLTFRIELPCQRDIKFKYKRQTDIGVLINIIINLWAIKVKNSRTSPDFGYSCPLRHPALLH